MSGTDVYVGGSEVSDNEYVPTYWKNEVPIHLPPPNLSAVNTFSGQILSIFVLGPDVYLSGALQYNAGSSSGATYWKDGNATTLYPFPESYAVPYSIFVSGGNVYITGYLEQNGGNLNAMCWKNGTATKLSNVENFSCGLGISVFENDIYIAGYEDSYNDTPRATLWKNGLQTILSDSAGLASAVFVK